MATITPGITAGIVIYDQLGLDSRSMSCSDFLIKVWTPYVEEHGVPEFGKIPPEWWALRSTNQTPQ